MCKKTSQLTSGGAKGLPRYFAINSLLDDTSETFGGGDSATIGRHGFRVKETFSCAFCLNLMRDARYLSCGHSFCRECLTMQQQTTSDESQASSSQNRRHQPPHPHRSPDTNCRSLMEDVDEAKRRAQAGYQIQVLVRQINGRTLAINTNANATVGDLQREIKTRTSIDQSQQRLTFSVWNCKSI